MIGAAQVLSASLRATLNPSFAISVQGNNLLDQTYVSVADDLAVPEPGRSLAVSLHWTDAGR